MTKSLRKAIVKRSQLEISMKIENKYVSNSTVETMNKYKKDKIFLVNYTRKKAKSLTLN